MGDARDQIFFTLDGHEPEPHDGMNKLFRSSPTIASSSRPSTPATPSTTANDLEDSPKTVRSNMMLDVDTKMDSLTPALPAKSSLRASRLLATLPQKKKNVPETRPVLTPAAPHILYLSSEEDCSSSASDFSDCEYEYSSDDEKFEAKTELPARMVSVIFSGKPSIVELRRRSISPSSSGCSSSSSSRELQRTSTEPILNRKSSASSDLSMAYYHPPRSSSITTGNFETQQGHSFLQTDPFASKADSADEREAQQTRKASTMFKRTFSLVRKRSKPNLASAESLSIQPIRMEQVGEGKAENHVSDAWAREVPRGAQTYHEIMSSVRKNSSSSLSSPISEIASPVSPGKKLRSGFMSRRKSIRI